LYKTHSLVDISFSPDWVANSILTFTLVKNLSFSLLTKYVGQQYLDNTGSADRMMAAYFVNNFRINYAIFPKFMKEIDLTLLLNNIGNVKYVSNGYTTETLQQGVIQNSNYYFPQALLSFLGGVNLKF